MEGSLKKRTVTGTLWSSIERFSSQGVAFLVMIIMARLLTPLDYGLVGMVAIFMAVSQSLIDSGFSQALIRKQDRSEIDNSTVFYFNIGVGIFLYGILYISAPLISNFYHEPRLISITRVISLGLLFNSLCVVQRAIFTQNLDFKTQAKATLISAILSGIIGILMALYGYGVWAIVIYQISNTAFIAILLWIFSKWRPILKYSWKSFIELFGFGSKLMLTGIIDTIYKNLYLIIIGKVFKASDLGYYTRASQFADFPSSNVTGIFQRVTYPVLCSIQNDDARLTSAYIRLLRMSAYIIFPLMTLLAAVAHPLVISILTDKWLFASILLVPICLAQMWFPVQSINLNILLVKGRSDLILKLEIIKKILGVIIICITVPFGLMTMCWGLVVNSLVALIINTYYTGKFISLGFFKQMRNLSSILFLSIGTGIIVWSTIQFLPLFPWFQLLIGLVEGFIIYAAISRLLNFNEFSELIAIIRRKG